MIHLASCFDRTVRNPSNSKVTLRFPSNEFDVLIVVEGENVLARRSWKTLRSFVTDVQLIDGARGIVSLFSAREPPRNGVSAAALSRRATRGRCCDHGECYGTFEKSGPNSSAPL